MSCWIKREARTYFKIAHHFITGATNPAVGVDVNLSHHILLIQTLYTRSGASVSLANGSQRPADEMQARRFINK